MHDQVINNSEATEKSKKNVSSIRTKTVLNDADAHLTRYLSPGKRKLILAGNQKVINTFLSLTHYFKFIIGKIPGSFDMSELGRVAWLTYVREQRNEDETFVQEQVERNKGRMIEGLEQAWKATHEGKGYLLILEKDFHCKAYQRPNQFEILLQPPRRPYKIFPDAVDELIKIAKGNNVKILLTENDHLKKMGHSPLLLLY